MRKIPTRIIVITRASGKRMNLPWKKRLVDPVNQYSSGASQSRAARGVKAAESRVEWAGAFP